MTTHNNEAEIRQALDTYIEDPSQRNHKRLAHMVLGDREDTCLFEALVEYTDQRQKPAQGFPFVM